MNEVAKAQLVPEWEMPIAGHNDNELFVINLCASMTPMPALPKQLKGFEKYRLYQVSRQEDGRRRYRLRLGFFTSEADAEMVVSAVRNLYPAAFAGCVTSEDQRYVDDSVSSTPSSLQTARPIAGTPVALELTRDAIPPTESIETVKQTSADEHSIKTPVAETMLSLLDEPAIVPPSRESMDISTATVEKASLPAAPANQPPIMSASIISSPMSRDSSGGAAANKARQIPDDAIPVLDSTLTIRALTRAEAEDPSRPKWFVVQLTSSEQPFNLDTMPKLDIFVAYNLYSVALMENSTIRHALRLGFFREQVAAEAVMGYLKTFFASASINQVSGSEHDRFAESNPVQSAPPPDNVINLGNTRDASARPAGADQNQPATTIKRTTPVPAKPATVQRVIPTVTQAANKVSPPPRPQSFLSRLIGRQLD